MSSSSMVTVSLSYRPLSDTATVRLVDGCVDGLDADRTSVEVDFDTRVECLDIDSDEHSSAQRIFVGAFLAGVDARRRFGLRQTGVPDVLMRHLFQLVAESRSNDMTGDPTAVAHTETPVTFQSLACRDQSVAPIRRPLHEVKAISAALSDIAAVVHSLPDTTWAAQCVESKIDEIRAIALTLRVLADSVDEANGLLVPGMAAHAASTIQESSVFPLDLVHLLSCAVLLLSDHGTWHQAACDVRSATQLIKNLRA